MCQWAASHIVGRLFHYVVGIQQPLPHAAAALQSTHEAAAWQVGNILAGDSATKSQIWGVFWKDYLRLGFELTSGIVRRKSVSLTSTWDTVHANFLLSRSGDHVTRRLHILRSANAI